jgi:hypothetical protein
VIARADPPVAVEVITCVPVTAAVVPPWTLSPWVWAMIAAWSAGWVTTWLLCADGCVTT